MHAVRVKLRTARSGHAAWVARYEPVREPETRQRPLSDARFGLPAHAIHVAQRTLTVAADAAWTIVDEFTCAADLMVPDDVHQQVLDGHDGWEPAGSDAGGAQPPSPAVEHAAGEHTWEEAAVRGSVAHLPPRRNVAALAALDDEWPDGDEYDEGLADLAAWLDEVLVGEHLRDEAPY